VSSTRLSRTKKAVIDLPVPASPENPLALLTDAELQQRIRDIRAQTDPYHAEIKRREALAARVAIALRERVCDAVADNVAALLRVFQEHDDTTCSDAFPRRYTADPPGCARCYLLHLAKERGRPWVDRDLKFRLVIELDRLEDPE
jgi:hypothetical protein